MEPILGFLYIKLLRKSPPIHWFHSPDLKPKGLIVIWCVRSLPKIISVQGYPLDSSLNPFNPRYDSKNLLKQVVIDMFLSIYVKFHDFRTPFDICLDKFKVKFLFIFSNCRNSNCPVARPVARRYTGRHTGCIPAAYRWSFWAHFEGLWFYVLGRLIDLIIIHMFHYICF